MGIGEGINAIEVSAESGLLLACRDFSGQFLHRTENNFTLSPLIGHTQEVKDIALSPNGKWIATCGNDGIICLWDRQGYKLRDFWAAHFGRSVLSVQFSLDSRFLISTGEDQTARLWDLNYNRIKQFKCGGMGALIEAAFLPGDKFLVTANVNGMIRLWKNPLFSTESNMPHTGEIWCMDIHPDGNHFITGGADKTVKYWDITTGEVLWTYKTSNTVTSLAVSSDGSYAALGLWNGEVCMLDLADGVQIRRFRSGDCSQGGQQGHTSTVSSVAFSADGRYILSAGRDERVICREWESSAVEAENRIGITPIVACAHRGFDFAIGTGDRAVALYETVLDTKERGIRKKSDDKMHFGARVLSLRYAPDDRSLLITGQSGKAALYKKDKTGKPQVEFPHPGDVSIYAADFSNDGSSVYTGSSDGVVRRFSSESGQLLEEALLNPGGVFSLRVLPGNGGLLSAGADGRATLSGTAQLEAIQYYRGGAGKIIWAAPVEKGEKIAVGTDMGYVSLYEKDKNVRAVFQHPAPGKVNVFAVSSLSSRYIIAGLADGSVYQWDTAHVNRPPKLLGKHQSEVIAVDFNENGNYALSASRDGHLIIWKMDLGDSLRFDSEICPVAGYLDKAGKYEIHFSQWLLSAAKFSNDGQYVLLGTTPRGANRLCRVLSWDLCASNNLPVIYLQHDTTVTALGFSSRGD